MTTLTNGVRKSDRLLNQSKYAAKPPPPTKPTRTSAPQTKLKALVPLPTALQTFADTDGDSTKWEDDTIGERFGPLINFTVPALRAIATTSKKVAQLAAGIVTAGFEATSEAVNQRLHLRNALTSHAENPILRLHTDEDDQKSNAMSLYHNNNQMVLSNSRAKASISSLHVSTSVDAHSDSSQPSAHDSRVQTFFDNNESLYCMTLR